MTADPSEEHEVEQVVDETHTEGTIVTTADGTEILVEGTQQDGQMI